MEEVMANAPPSNPKDKKAEEKKLAKHQAMKAKQKKKPGGRGR
jgi:hypothetical protein